MEFLHQIVYTLHDFLLKPIWSAKQLKTNPPIEIPIDHHERLSKMANRIYNNFNEHCREIAIHQGWSLNAARVNTSIMIVCWKDWQDASLLLTDLINELWLKHPYIGALALTIQKQVYLQILLYGTFLGAGHGSATEAKRRLLPQLHKYLFEGLAKQEAIEMQVSGQNVEVQKTLPAHRGQSLQMIVTEQHPGPHDVVFLPGPAVGPWITGEQPKDYREMIRMHNKQNQFVLQIIEVLTIGEVIAKDEPLDNSVLREILIPPTRQLNLIPRPRLREATHEPTPPEIQAITLAYMDKKTRKAAKRERDITD